MIALKPKTKIDRGLESDHGGWGRLQVLAELIWSDCALTTLTVFDGKKMLAQEYEGSRFGPLTGSVQHKLQSASGCRLCVQRFQYPALQPALY